MCITINRAELSNTKILSLTLENGNHFISYSNKVKDLSGKPNAMILPIPGETKPEWFHNTEGYKDFMNEITKKCRLEEDYRGERTRGMSSLSKGISEFKLGMYRVGLSENFNDIKEFLKKLPDAERPVISEELQNFFQYKYAGWSFAICIFESGKKIDAQPIAFEYKPFGENLLYFPTMDSHDGGAPNINELVNMDHTFIFEHNGVMNEEYVQKFVTLDAPVPDFLQNRKYRALQYKGQSKNGDTYVNIKEMSEMNFAADPKFGRIPPVTHRNDILEQEKIE